MPRDYDLDAKAVSGFKSDGPANIVGSPEGLEAGDALRSSFPNWKYMSSGKGPGTGVIRGNPVGISGEVRRMTSAGLKGAIGRRLGG